MTDSADPEPVAPTLHLAPGVDLAALEQALLRARATELSEVRRRQVRLSAGYGDATTRAAMDDEADRARARHDALNAVLEALRNARS